VPQTLNYPNQADNEERTINQNEDPLHYFASKYFSYVVTIDIFVSQE